MVKANYLLLKNIELKRLQLSDCRIGALGEILRGDRFNPRAESDQSSAAVYHSLPRRGSAGSQLHCPTELDRVTT